MSGRDTALRAVVTAALVASLWSGRSRADAGASTAPTLEPGPGNLADAGEVYAPGRRPRPDGPVVASVEAEDLARWNVGGSSDPTVPSNRPGFHPAARVHVSLDEDGLRLPEHASGRRGVLSRTAVLSQARNHGYWPFRLCYEDGLRRGGQLSGTTVLRLTVGRSGRVTKGAIVETDLHQSDVSQCLVGGASRLRFSPGPAHAFAVRLVVELRPGDASLPDVAVGEPGGNEPHAPPIPSLGAARVLTALSGAREAVMRCFASAAATDPRLWGRLALLLDVDQHGRPVRVTQHESRFPSPEVVTCARQAAEAARFGTGPGEGAGSRLVWALKLGAPPPTRAATDGAASIQALAPQTASGSLDPSAPR